MWLTFREGNGRSARIWLDAHAEKGIGRGSGLERNRPGSLFAGMERSPVNDAEIKDL